MSDLRKVDAAPVKGIEVSTHLAHDLISIRLMLAAVEGIEPHPPDRIYSLSLYLADELRAALEKGLHHLAQENETLRHSPAS